MRIVCGLFLAAILLMPGSLAYTGTFVVNQVSTPFDPDEITVVADTVQWRHSSGSHTVTIGTGPEDPRCRRPVRHTAGFVQSDLQIYIRHGRRIPGYQALAAGKNLYLSVLLQYPSGSDAGSTNNSITHSLKLKGRRQP
jgi:plastocyanin